MSSALTLTDWLDERLKERGWTRRELAQAMEVSEAALYSWLAPPDAPHQRQISPRNADTLARALGVSPNEVRDVAGPPRRRSQPPFSPAHGHEGLRAVRVLFVPVIGIVPADSLRKTAAIGELIPVPAANVQNMVNPKAVIVSGECLTGRGIHDGDYLVIEADQDAMNPRDGDIVIVRVGDDLTVKEWWQIGEQIVLRRSEPGHKTIELSPEMDGDIEVIGAARSVLSSRKL